MMRHPSNPYDIFAIASQRNPTLYKQMRQEAPVHGAVHPQTGKTIWFLTRYDDCRDFLKDKRFGKQLERDVSYIETADDIINKHMLNLDDPDHSRLKSLVHLAFIPARIEILRPQLQQIADSLMDAIDADVAEGEPFDLTQRYIAQLPLLSIATMLGIPLADYQKLYQWTHDMLLQDSAVVHQALNEFSSYLDKQITLRQTQSTSYDLLSGLMLSEKDGDTLSRQELLAMVFLLITAGYETMVNFISNAITTLMAHPQQLQLMRNNLDNQAFLNRAVEELLRYSGPSHMTLASYALEDVVIREMRIARGEVVHAVLFAANRDPLIFDNPNIFNIERVSNKHIAFSYGIHHCLGAALARLEGDIAITTLIRRMPYL